jgi:hypothetical protein
MENSKFWPIFGGQILQFLTSDAEDFSANANR